jgi:hypothetical protein
MTLKNLLNILMLKNNFFILLLVLALLLIASACLPEAPERVIEQKPDIDEVEVIFEKKVPDKADIQEEEVLEEITADRVDEEKEGPSLVVKEEKEEAIIQPPEFELKVILGPEYAQEGLISFYRVEAVVKNGNISNLRFNKDDSNGSWGPRIAQVNLLEGESFTLVCEASNEAGMASRSITLNWSGDPSVPNIEPAEPADLKLSSGDYLIDVNLSAQRVTVYHKGQVLRSMPCSGGEPETPTPTGTFITNQKIKYSYVERFGQAAYYWTRFYGPYLFHSVPYDKEGNLLTEELAKIGSPASHGCIRLYLEDAKWMYDELPLGVTVNIGY